MHLRRVHSGLAARHHHALLRAAHVRAAVIVDSLSHLQNFMNNFMNDLIRTVELTGERAYSVPLNAVMQCGLIASIDAIVIR